MISAWFVLVLLAANVIVAAANYRKAKALDARNYELDCRHLSLLAAERIHNDNATALASYVRFQVQRGGSRVEVA